MESENYKPLKTNEQQFLCVSNWIDAMYLVFIDVIMGVMKNEEPESIIEKIRTNAKLPCKTCKPELHDICDLCPPLNFQVLEKFNGGRRIEAGGAYYPRQL